ncbi:MAG: TlpA family protein disulfide reductase [Sphingobacteriales bacterium]
MKTNLLKAFFKIGTVCILVFSFMGNGKAQSSTNVNDTNIIYKDIDGKIMTKDAALSFMSKGNFNIKKDSLADGKIAIVLYHETEEEKEKKMKLLSEKLNKLVNQPFPAFTLTNTEGKRFTQSGFYKGVSVINSWFIGCEPCFREMPELNRVVNKYKEQAVNFVAFTFNETDAVKKFTQKNKFNYIQIPGAENLIKQLSISSYPTHMILDKNGIIKKIFIGGSNDLYEKLTTLIEEVKKNQ